MIKILSAAGGSKHADRAVRLSCKLAAAHLAELTVLTIDDPDEINPIDQVRSTAMELAQNTNIKIELLSFTGHPDQVIRDTALKGYDLLVIGARGLHIAQDFFLGRNAIRLVKDLPVATLVVRKNETIKQILWRIPRGPVDEKYIKLVMHIVNTLQADLTLLEVEPSAYLFGRRQPANQSVSDCKGAGVYLNQLRSRLQEATGRQISCRVRSGIPEEVILDEAAVGGYDLVAVSALPRRGLGRLFFENLPYRVARNIPVSVLLLG